MSYTGYIHNTWSGRSESQSEIESVRIQELESESRLGSESVKESTSKH